MSELLDPAAVYDRGLADLSSLQGVERVIFMLQDFDNLMEMEGWDHFFLYENHFRWYGEFKEWLFLLGDSASLSVLKDYENYLKAHNVGLCPREIENFLSSLEEAELSGQVDWREQFCALRADRWARATAFLRSRGVALLVFEADRPASDSHETT